LSFFIIQQNSIKNERTIPIIRDNNNNIGINIDFFLKNININNINEDIIRFYFFDHHCLYDFL